MTQVATLTRRRHCLQDFRNLHASGSVIVCGCGASLTRLADPYRFITIGVNDVGRLFQPNYLVVIDGREHFKDDRFSYVESSQADYIFTQRTNLGLPHPRVLNFRLGDKERPDDTDPDVLPFSCAGLMTPHVAICLALHMGARHIGLIGVDLTANHFFGATGTHEWLAHLASIDREFAKLGAAALARGSRIFNLSDTSRLTAFPKMTVDTFAVLPAQPPPEKSHSIATRHLQIVSYATTPLGGVPVLLARCINARTQHHARCVWAADRYSTGISFNSDINWSQAPAQAKAELEAADVIVLHNGKVDDRHRHIIDRKPIVTMAHNYLANVDDRYVRAGFPGLVVGQYQATLPEFRDWSLVPNPMPLWEDAHQPGAKSADITIAYTPSDKHPTYPREHPLYWHSKGYDCTLRVLDRLAIRYPIRLDVTRDRFLPHIDILRIKRRAHIVIDECVTGSYHRNSLEGLATGCVVVNGVGLLPGVLDALRNCADDPMANPFLHADLDTLETLLATLIELGPDLLTTLGADNRTWMQQHWDFGRQWARFWQPAMDAAIATAGYARCDTGSRTVL